MFKKRIHIKKIKNIFLHYNNKLIREKGRDKYIGGYKIKMGEIDASDPTFKAYLLQRSYQNFYQAITKVGIPIMMVYTTHERRSGLVSGLYLLTKGSEEDELEDRLKILESTFYAVFPTFTLSRLSGRELKNIMTFGSIALEEDSGRPPVIFETPQPTESIIRDIPKFYIPILENNKDYNKITLGKFIDEGGVNTNIEYYITLDEISSHLACLGITGSGKSTTVSTILNQLPKHIKYLVLDFHNEYTRYLKNIELIIRPGKDEGTAINPLEPLFSSNTAEHIALVSDIFGDTYNFTHPQTYVFKIAMETTLNNYRQLGEREANLNALVKMIEKYPIRSYYENETKMALLRRLKPLIEGQAKMAFIGSKYIRINQILNKNVVVELGHLRETKVRQIYSQLLLKQLYDYRLSLGINDLQHITVIEEARYIVPYRRDYEEPRIAERMINEMRKFGESIFLISQFPSQVSKDTIKNCGYIIIHRIVGHEDLRHILNILNLNQKQINYIKKMDIGEAIIRDPRFPEPIHIYVEPQLIIQ
jgi:DNA helicase HerA-like ATPase